VLDHLACHFGLDAGSLSGNQHTLAAELNLVSPGFDGFPFHTEPVRIGLPIAHTRRHPPTITTEGAHLLGAQAGRNCVELADWKDVFAFANRFDHSWPATESGQVLIRYQKHALGHGWLTDESVVLSRFPRTGWQFGPPGEVSQSSES
jgi:hypothetical protein